DILAALLLFEFRHLLEVGARDVVQLERKWRSLEFSESIRYVVDRIIRNRQRTVTARITGGELKIGIDFFAGFDTHVNRFTAFSCAPARIRVQYKFSVHQVATILEQPVDTVSNAALSPRRERENDIAIGVKSFLFEADQSGH